MLQLALQHQADFITFFLIINAFLNSDFVVPSKTPNRSLVSTSLVLTPKVVIKDREENVEVCLKSCPGVAAILSQPSPTGPHPLLHHLRVTKFCVCPQPFTEQGHKVTSVTVKIPVAFLPLLCLQRTPGRTPYGIFPLTGEIQPDNMEILH